MKRIAIAIATTVVAAGLLDHSAQAAARTWGNTGTDYNASASWNAGAGPAPGTGDVGKFTAAEVTQPNLSASLSNSGLYFNGTGVSGYDITGSASVSLTLTGNSTSGSSGTSDSSAAAIRSDATSGTNTIDVPLILAPTSVSTFFNATGGTLVVNSTISESAAGKSLSLKNGTIQLNGNNSFSGGASIDAASTTLIVGNDNALGSGTFTVNSTATVQAGGGARTLANNVVFGGTTTIGGSNAITFNGNASTSGANSRTVTVNNTALTTFGGSFTINGNTSAGTFLINGTGNATISGSIADGAMGTSVLSHGGTGTLTLANTNSYSGGTNMSGGTTISTHNGAFGTGNVSLTANNVTLTLQGVTDSISDTANLNIGVLGNTGDLVNLNFNGTETVAGLFINGVQQAAGTWGAPGSGAENTDPTLAGTGFLDVTVGAIPEPATWMLMGLGLLVGALRLRGKA
jgi:autotransporter-associated beta strand protein